METEAFFMAQSGMRQVDLAEPCRGRGQVRGYGRRDMNAPRLAVLSNGTVHLKDADQPSAGARSPFYTAPAVGGVFCVDDV